MRSQGIPFILTIPTVLYLMEFIRHNVFPQGVFQVIGLIVGALILLVLSAMYSLQFLIALNLRDAYAFHQDDLVRDCKEITDVVHPSRGHYQWFVKPFICHYFLSIDTSNHLGDFMVGVSYCRGQP